MEQKEKMEPRALIKKFIDFLKNNEPFLFGLYQGSLSKKNLFVDYFLPIRDTGEWKSVLMSVLCKNDQHENFVPFKTKTNEVLPILGESSIFCVRASVNHPECKEFCFEMEEDKIGAGIDGITIVLDKADNLFSDIMNTIKGFLSSPLVFPELVSPTVEIVK